MHDLQFVSLSLTLGHVYSNVALDIVQHFYSFITLGSSISVSYSVSLATESSRV